LLLCFAARPLPAQDAPAETRALAVTQDDLLNRYCEANGGREHLKNVRSLRIEAVMTMRDGGTGKLIYIKEQPFYMRSIWYGPNGTVVRKGYNGQHSWELFQNFDGRERFSYLPGRPQDVFEWVLVDPEACGATLEMLPLERVGRDECYRVRASYADGTIRDFWLDTTTLCEVRVEATSPDGRVSTFLVEKPAKYDGIWFPGVQREIMPDGSFGTAIEITDVQMNIGLLPCFFDPPQRWLNQKPETQDSGTAK
jgi:hypothetical protein